MKCWPHHYHVNVEAGGQDHTEISSPGLTPFVSAPPAEFDGPGDLWSPETLLVGAVADCFVLTFKAITATAKLRWTKIQCAGQGILDRADDGVRFTDVFLRVRLEVPAETDPERAHRLLEKAEKACLVGNSLRFRPVLTCEVVAAEAPQLLAS